ncbi:hypothetical protein [Blastococcus tunisiensis]|uniref:Uncharacterized protein n=1 Tax=Blastococcus tunisiensis TaxID=1798228 RepID=A0A1I2EPU6_9ACTN|nr:hypothetical protein [Blastococcus sp. DSM 46838]SFE95114.1 hypothetical protein SAMN05216574_107154 [Blastococcus sp. DSM 46838]
MTDAATATQAPAASAPPAFEPDVELIDHLEGNERAIKRYRDHAESQREKGA